MSAGKSPGLRRAGLRKVGDPGAVAGAVVPGGGDMIAANNLSDLTNPSVAAFNLGLGTGAFVTAGDYARQDENLSGLASASTARTNLGLDSMATQAAGAVAITGGTITGIGTPAAAGDAAPKSYVDAMVAGLAWKASVVAATTANGALATAFAAGQTVDGVVLAAGDRLLVKNQTAGAENGLYVVQASGAPVRASDADTGPELVSSAVFVQGGTVNADRAFVVTNNAITLGTTAITVVGFASVLGALVGTNNLSDLASAATARTNLGLGTMATQAASAVAITGGTIRGLATAPTLGGDVVNKTYCDLQDAVLQAQLANFLVIGNNLSDLGNVATARSNLGLATVAASGSASDLGTGTVPAARLPDFVASGSGHAHGAVPDPSATAGVTKFLREDSTWSTLFPDEYSGTLSAQMDNFNPSGMENALIVRLSIPSAQAATGIAGGWPGRILYFQNIGPGTLTFYSLNGGSASANQFSFPGGVVVNLVTNGTLLFFYSGQLSKWIPLTKLVTSATTYDLQVAYSGGLTSPADLGYSRVFWEYTQNKLVADGLMAANGRIQERKGTDVASATTLTLPGGSSAGGGGGNLHVITGATTIAGIVTDGWQAGSHVQLRLPSGITVTHNSGAPGAGAVAILLRAAASLTTAKIYLLDLVYDGTNWLQPD